MDAKDTKQHAKAVHALFDQHVPALLALLADRRPRPRDVLHIRVAGAQGGDWTINTRDETVSCVRGLHGDPTRRITIAANDLLGLLEAKRSYRSVFGGIDISVILDDTPQVELTPEELSDALLAALSHTFIKIDHKQNPPMDGANVYSFITFGPTLAALGLADRPLDVPISEHTPGDFAQWATFGSAGWYTIDRIRFLVNNLQARLGPSTTTVTLEPGAIKLDISFTSNNPTLEGQARAYLVWFFGIPLGWVDTAFPDIHIPDFQISLRLAPDVTGAGEIALAAVAVEFQGTLQTNFIGDAVADKVRDAIRDAFQGVLDTKEFRDGFARAISMLLASKHDPPIKTWVELRIEPSGIIARGNP
jgi:hypothetical protein